MVAANIAYADNHDVEFPDEAAGVIKVGDNPVANDPSIDSTVDARVIGFLSRLQTLEREYSRLQGRVEELEHFYQEERHLNRKRFLDLDRRLRELTGGQLAPADALTSEEDANTESGIYRRAIAFIDAQNYSEAKNALIELISTYPNGERVPDAMYWLGDLNFNIEPKNLETARQNFVQLITLYSDHSRIPLAITKLGMIYHELGNVDRAREYLGRVMSEFPDHDAARIAETYDQNLQ